MSPVVSPEPSPWPARLPGLVFGGDYNPEQWPESVWHEDVALMREAGVTAVTVGVFSWSRLEPAPGSYDVGWLDRVLALLHGAGIAVILATPTAAPPAWFSRRHPESLPVTHDGTVLGIGARESFCPSSPAYRQAARGIAEMLGRRYAEHPALALWHVNNEYGAHVGPCYCETSAASFRNWLRVRYGDLGTVNQVWGTEVWGQHYADWDEITPPRRAPMPVNPAQQLDFLRFSSDEYLACFVAEREVLRTYSPDVPVTTNVMATNCRHIDYWRWCSEMDLAANNHYLQAENPENHVELAMSADLTRALAGGRPWLLMEHSTSAVSWQPRNLAKSPGEMRRNSITHLARGADGTMFFQWRASRVGAEKFHSAMLPHGGTKTRVWGEVVELGRDLGRLAEVKGARVHADIALVWDWESWWALELEFRPSCDVTYPDRVRAFYTAWWQANRTVDFVSPTADLSAYRVVCVPNLYLTRDDAAKNVHRYVQEGGTLLVSFFSGITDENDAVHPGAYPGALRDVLGLWIDEFHPLRSDVQVALDDGLTGDVWSERVVLDGAEAVLSFRDGPDRDAPVLTRHRLGAGTAWYLATRLDPPDLARVLERVTEPLGLPPVLGRGDGVEVVRRRAGANSYVFCINHTEDAADVAVSGTDLLTGTYHDTALSLLPGGVAVIREPTDEEGMT